MLLCTRASIGVDEDGKADQFDLEGLSHLGMMIGRAVDVMKKICYAILREHLPFCTLYSSLDHGTRAKEPVFHRRIVSSRVLFTILGVELYGVKHNTCSSIE